MIDRARTPTRHLAAIAVLAAALSVDLTPHRFPHLAAGRWVLFIALGGAGLWFARSPNLRPLAGVRSSQLSAGERLLVAAFVWTLIVAPLSPTPWRSALLAAALTGTAVLGVAVGRRVPWSDLQAAVMAGLTSGLAVAVVLGDRGSLDGRWIGLSEEANALGVVAALAIVAGAGMLARKGWSGLPAVAMGTLVLFQTAAVVPALGAVLGLSMAARPALGRLRPRLDRAVPAVLGSIYAAGALSILFLDGDHLGDWAHDLKSLNRRTGIRSYLAERVVERPFTGFGPWSSADLLSEGAFDARADWGPTHSHNVLIELATMGGLPAAALFLAAAAVTGWRLVGTGHPGLALAVTLLMVSVTEHLVASPSIALFLFATIVGATSCKEPTPERGRRLRERPGTSWPSHARLPYSHERNAT